MRILMFVAVAMAASIGLWVATLLQAPAPIDLNSRATLYAAAGILLSAAAMIGSGLLWWNSRNLEPGSSTSTGTGSGKVERRSDLGGITALAIVATAILLIAGVVTGEVNPVRAALMLLLGGGALFTILVVVDRLAAGSEVEVSSHWGGLGGSLGGWRISQTAILLILALILVSATIVASGGLEPDEVDNKSDSNTSTTADGDSDGNETDPDSNETVDAANAAVDEAGNVGTNASTNETAANGAEGVG